VTKPVPRLLPADLEESVHSLVYATPHVAEVKELLVVSASRAIVTHMSLGSLISDTPGRVSSSVCAPRCCRAAFASRKGKVQAELIVVHACMQVREQLALKYGQVMMQEAQSNLSFNAPLRIVQLLSYHPPSKVLAH